MPQPTLSLCGVREHNLRAFDLDLPHGCIVAITGRSGSGKSSLAFDTVFREGERRYLASLSPHARRLFGRVERPRVTSIEGVRPVIAVDQRIILRSPRSTVGTLSTMGDELRLLLARFGTQSCPACSRPRPASPLPRAQSVTCACGRPLAPLTRALLSFNTPAGACPACRGLGLEDRVDPELLVADASKSLREGALVPTTPNGYIVYSQVTPEVMNELCQAHGFDIDTPWQDLDDAQRGVVLYGSKRIQVPFGKHPLESRMKWSGIKVKPRELGYYRGIARVIEETLEKKRNDNVLRFVRSIPCSACAGSRLNEDARAVALADVDMAGWNVLDVATLPEHAERALEGLEQAHLARPITDRIVARCRRLERLGLAHLQLSRPAASLSGGEARRLHLATQLGCELSGLAYVFDEPGAGAHVRERERLANILEELRERRCSVFLVEHDPIFQSRADHVVEIGPGAGRAGGRLVYSGPPRASDRTLEALRWNEDPIDLGATNPNASFIELRGARGHNLRDLTVRFLHGGFTVVSGVSGSGKTTLVEATLARALAARLQGARERPAEHDELVGLEGLTKLVLVDQKEIGRSSRSNPATYSGAFDRIRALFANTAAARDAGFDKGRFSFNKEGGRCPRCEGAGVETIGLMSLPGIEQTCSACNGQRFDERTLAVELHGLSIRDVLALTIDEAAEFFRLEKAGDAKLIRVLESLRSVGLGYLQLGQGVPTLSGGEAQRLKLAKELARTEKGCVLVLDEPTNGLHPLDVDVLHAALCALLKKGVTVVAVEHDPRLIVRADWVIDLGPDSGPGGGALMAQGPPELIAREQGSVTGAVLRQRRTQTILDVRPRDDRGEEAPLRIAGVRTRNLQNVTLTLEPGLVHVVSGVSGSGKSALVFDTLASEGRRMFAESFSPYLRRELMASRQAELESASGLRPSLAIRTREERRATGDARSTLGTFSELDDFLRLLFARLASLDSGAAGEWTASHFSFNHVLGACSACDGRGHEELGDVERLIEDGHVSILAGALESTRGGRFLFETKGRHFAVLQAGARALGHDLEPGWNALTHDARSFVADGSGETLFDVVWEHAQAQGERVHSFRAAWPGVERLLAEEFEKKRERKLGPALKELLREAICTSCAGGRLQGRAANVRIGGLRLAELRALPLSELGETLAALGAGLSALAQGVLDEVRLALEPTLGQLLEIGLGYLALDRPTHTLSSGERRRLEIAKQLVFGLRDICYILDEPCLGLHAQDRGALVETIRKLALAGNTVCCVEHDLDFIRACDRVHDIGPEAGPEGGRIVAVGTPDQIAAETTSWTGRFLSGAERIRRTNESRGEANPGPRIVGATRHNLAGIDLELELGRILCVCGVSGSGKSTLVLDVVAQSLGSLRPVGCADLLGADRVVEVVRADAPFHGAGPGSLVATALDLMDPLRTIFAKTDDARTRGLSRAAFSPSSPKGRCPDCRGTGEHRISFDFLPDAAEICRTCEGARYQPDVLACRWEGASIARILSLPLSASTEHFARHKDILATLERMVAIGLGHLSLGRRFDSLSHGERQRLRLVRELGRESTASGPKLFVFDEPANGLHARDQQRLLCLFEELAAVGHGVLFSEHALGLIACADRVIELGPGAADDGGRIVFDGTPLALTRADTPTGRALRASANCDVPPSHS